MKFKVTLGIVAIFAAISMYSCKFSCVKGDGNVTTEVRNIGTFTKVSLEGVGKIFIRQGDAPKIEIKADHNLTKYIKTELSGSRLVINNDRCIESFSVLEVYVTTRQLENIKLNGSGDIICDNEFVNSTLDINLSGSGNITVRVNSKKVKTDISGSGKIKLSGSCEVQKIDISGSGSLQAYNLLSKEVDINLSGNGTCEIFASDELDVNVSGSGNVRYKGNPRKTNTSVSGSGLVKNVE